MRKKIKIPPKSFWDDDRWAHENYQTLLKMYANKWVAILNRSVICSNEDLRQVKVFLSKKFKGKTVPLLRIEDASHVY